MTHAELDELYELYAMGALESEAAAEIERHLIDGCVYCTEQVREASQLAALLAGIAEPAQPRAELRSRVLNSIARPRLAVTAAKSSPNWMFGMAALCAACLALAVFSLGMRSELQRMREQLVSTMNERDQLRSALASANSSERSQLAVLTGERDQLRSALAVMRRPDTRSVRFGTATAPHGWVFVNRNGGLVVVGSELPRVANDRTLELWLVPKTGAPQPAGLVRPTDASGDAIHVSSVPVDPAQIKAVAFSNEPRAGSPAPTTKPFLLVPLG